MSKKMSKEELAEQEKVIAQQKLMESIQVKDGTYQVIVHVIEARSLKSGHGKLYFDVIFEGCPYLSIVGEGLLALASSGVPDPMVKVEVEGQTKNTRVLPQVENGVFDDTFKVQSTRISPCVGMTDLLIVRGGGCDSGDLGAEGDQHHSHRHSLLSTRRPPHRHVQH